MTFSTNVYPNLIDWANLAGPDGIIQDIAWLLAQCNEILRDAIFHEGNLPLGHQCSVNSGLPQGTWRGNNEGTPASKPLFDKFQFNIGTLTAYSKVDKYEANLNGQVGKFRWTQDQSHIEGMSQQVATEMFYGNESVNPKRFTGFSPYYSSLSTATQQTAANVINAGGSGNSNASMWVISMGDSTTFNIFPKGSQAGLVYEDKGDIRELYDDAGNGYEGYTSYFAWQIGLVVANWEYNVRIANIDTTTAGLLGTTPPDLNVLLAEAVNLLPTAPRRLSGITQTDAPGDPVPGTLPGIYCNRAVRTALDIQAIRDKNVLINSTEYAGMPVLLWRDVPIRLNDSLIKTEAAVA